MQSIMAMNIKGDSVEIFKKIWHWLFGKKELESYEDMKARMLEEINILKIECSNLKALKAQEMYNKGIREREGTKIKGGVNTRPTTPRPNFTPPPRDFKKEADEHFRQQQARRDSDDNFLTGAMVGYIIADSLNDSPSARDIEVPKSSNYESSYTPSSSSSYDSGSYSSSSSSSCDSGC